MTANVSQMQKAGTNGRARQMSLLQEFTAATGRPQQQRTVTHPPPTDIRYRNRDPNQISDIGKFKSEKLFEKAVFEALGDLNLRSAPLGKVARALADEAIQWEDVARAASNARQCVLDGKCPHPWVYFVGAMKRKFEEIGRPWKK